MTFRRRSPWIMIITAHSCSNSNYAERQHWSIQWQFLQPFIPEKRIRLRTCNIRTVWSWVLRHRPVWHFTHCTLPTRLLHQRWRVHYRSNNVCQAIIRSILLFTMELGTCTWTPARPFSKELAKEVHVQWTVQLQQWCITLITCPSPPPLVPVLP